MNTSGNSTTALQATKSAYQASWPPRLTRIAVQPARRVRGAPAPSPVRRRLSQRHPRDVAPHTQQEQRGDHDREEQQRVGDHGGVADVGVLEADAIDEQGER